MHAIIFFFYVQLLKVGIGYSKRETIKGPITGHFYEVFNSGARGLWGIVGSSSDRISWRASCGSEVPGRVRVAVPWLLSKQFRLSVVVKVKHHEPAARVACPASALGPILRAPARPPAPGARSRGGGGFAGTPDRVRFVLLRWPDWPVRNDTDLLKTCKWVLTPVDCYFILTVTL